MRKTKIICTLGPATERSETLRGLLAAGADVFRLNMSHAKHDWVREIVPRIRHIAAEIPRPVAILLDTQGPAIRTGEWKSNLELKPGDILEFTVCGAKSEEKYSVDVNYEGLINGLQNVWTPYANLVHHESASGGHQRTQEEQAQFLREATYMQRQWGHQLLFDPFYNPNLSLNLPGFYLANPPRREGPVAIRKSSRPGLDHRV